MDQQQTTTPNPEQTQKPTPPQNPPKKGGSCLRTIIWVLIVLILLVLAVEISYVVFTKKAQENKGSKDQRESPSANNQPVEEVEQNLQVICTNNASHFSVKVPDALITKFRDQNEKCMFFSFSDFSFPEVWDGPLTPITVGLYDKSKPQVIEDTTSGLDGTLTGLYIVNNGYDSTYISGTFNPEGLLSGRKLYGVVVRIDETHSLLFSSYDLTVAQKTAFDSLVKSVKLL